MTYTEFKRTVNNTNMQLLFHACRWFKTETKTTNVFTYFYIQPQSDAHEVIVRLLIEQLPMEGFSSYKCISINPYALLSVYDTEEQIQRCDTKYYTSTRYKLGRMMMVVSIDMIGYEKGGK